MCVHVRVFSEVSLVPGAPVLTRQVAVWVVDSTDRNRLEEAKTELMKIVGCRELTGVPLLTCRVPFPESLFEAIDLARLPSVYVSLA
eukprot:m.229995 g.229995  ORF g.229995 m.229995 type:complete len:87 (+) comp22403_c4_seq26:2191-2451(+)